jgi:hypothetical protein
MSTLNMSCESFKPASFGIYLAETGELVLSQQHIDAYDGAGHVLVLNEQGITRWNSFQHYTGIPKLDECLYNKEFILKIDGQDAGRGKFYSAVSSAGYAGLALLDVLFPLDAAHNKLQLISGYPDFSLGTEYAGLGSALENVFQRLGLLKKT